MMTNDVRHFGASGGWNHTFKAYLLWFTFAILGLGVTESSLAQSIDSDGDGHSDDVEIQIGTDPFSAESVFRILLPVAADPALGVTLSWSSVPGLEYRLQRWNAEDLGIINDPPWLDVASSVAETDLTTLSDNEPLAQDVRFYRVLAVLPEEEPEVPPTDGVELTPPTPDNTEPAVPGQLFLNLPEGTQTDSVALSGVEDLPSRIEVQQDGGFDIQIQRPAGVNVVRKVQAVFTDAAGGQQASNELWMALLDPDRFVPLDAGGTPQEGLPVPLDEDGSLLPFEYRPMGHLSLGRQLGLNIRFPDGANLIETAQGSRLVFQKAVGQFGEDAPLRFPEALSVDSNTTRQLPIGSLSISDIATAFAKEAVNGLSLIAYRNVRLQWLEGELGPQGIKRGRFSVQVSNFPLGGGSISNLDTVVSFDSTRGIQIPFAGTFQLPAGVGSHATIQAGEQRPIVLTIRPDGKMALSGPVAVEFPEGPKFRASLALEDTFYAFEIAADGVRIPMLASMAETLPADPAACIVNQSIEFTKDCLEAHQKAYATFIQSALATSLDVSDGNLFGLPDPDFDLPGDLITAIGYSATASGLQAIDLDALEQHLEQIEQSAQQTQSAVDLFAKWVGLQRVMAAMNEGNADEQAQSNVEAILLDVVIEMERLLGDPENLPPLENMAQILKLVTEVIPVMDAASTSASDAFKELMEDMLVDFVRHQAAIYQIESGVFDPLGNDSIEILDVNEAYQIMLTATGVYQAAIGLELPGIIGLEGEIIEDLPLHEWTIQLVTQLAQLLEGDLNTAELTGDVPGYFHALGNYLDLVALLETWVTPLLFDVSEDQLPNDWPTVAKVTEFAENATPLMIAELDRPYGDRSINNHGQAIRRLLFVLEDFPQDLTLPLPPIERAIEALDEPLTSAIDVIILNESTQELLDILAAGNMQAALARRFDLSTALNWESDPLTAVVDRLIDVSVERLDWVTLNCAVTLLSEACRFSESAEANVQFAYADQAARALSSMRGIAISLWESEFSRRANNPLLGLSDMLLPGDIQVDRAAGSFSYNRSTREFSGGFSGQLKLPELETSLTIQQASFRSTGALSIKAYGATQIPAEDPAFALSISRRRPVELEVTPAGQVSLRGGVELELPNGMKFASHIVWDEPYYGFGFEARSLRFELPEETQLFLPVFADLDAFNVQTARALNQYYRALNGTLENLAPLAELPELSAPGTLPAFETPVIDDPLQPLDLYAQFMSGQLEDLANASLDVTLEAVRKIVHQSSEAVKGLREEVVDHRDLLRNLQLRRQLAVELEKYARDENNQAIEILNELANSTVALARKQFEAASQEVDDSETVELTAEAALEAMEMLALVDRENELIGDYLEFLSDWREAIFTSVGLNPDTGEIANQSDFEQLILAQLDRRLQNTLTAIAEGMVAGDETVEISAFQNAYWHVTLRRRELLIQQYGLLAETDWRGRYKQLSQIETLLNEFEESYALILNNSFDFPSDVILLPGNGSRGAFSFELDYALLQQEYLSVYQVKRDPALTQELWDLLAAIGRGAQRTGQQIQADIAARAQSDVETLVSEINDYLSQDENLVRVDQLIAFMSSVIDVLELVEQLEVGEIDLAVSNLLPNITIRLTAIAEARKAWWLLHQYADSLITASREKLTQTSSTLSQAVRQSVLDTLQSQRVLAQALHNLKPTVQPFDLALPGDLQVRRIFGDLLYDRSNNDLRIKFGGRLEFPQFQDAYFEIVNATVDTAGSVSMALNTGGPLKLGDTQAFATAEASFNAQSNGQFSFSGEGEMTLQDSGPYEIDIRYEQAVNDGQFFNTLNFDTKAADVEWALADDFVIFDAGFGFSFRTDRPAGEIRVQGSAGMFKDERSTGDLSVNSFLLSVDDLSTSILTDFEGRYQLSLESGTLQLPVYFVDSEELGVGGPRVVLSEANPLVILLEPDSNLNGLRLSVDGSVTFENLTAVVPELDFVSGSMETATLTFNGPILPELSNINGSVKMELPSQEIQVDLINGAWSLGGYPSGTLALGADVRLFESSGFGFDILGGESCTVAAEEGVATGLTIFPAQEGQLPQVRLDGGVKMFLPGSMLAIDEPDPESETIEEDGQLSFLACGAVDILSDENGLPVPRIELETVGFAAKSLQLGGADGLRVKDAALTLEGLDNLLNNFSDGSFVIDLTGQLEIPEGPSFELRHAQFIFEGLEVPTFRVPEKVAVDFQEVELFEGFPVRITEAGLNFKTQTLPLPDLIQPDNIKITTSAEIGIDADPVTLSGRVDDLSFELENGQPKIALDGFGFGIEALEIPPLGLAGQVYISGLQNPGDNFENVYFSGLLGGQLSTAGVTAMVALTPQRLVGICLDVNAGPGGIPLGQTTLLFTGASGGVLFANTNQDPCEFLADFPVTAAVGPTPQSMQPQSVRPRRNINEYGMTWDELGARVSEQMYRDAVAEQFQTAMVDVGAVGQTDPSGRFRTTAVSTTPEQDVADLEIPCPNADCPPTTVNILCQPHPDQELYPNRVIIKFTSLDRVQATDILDQLGFTPQALEELGLDNAENIAADIAGFVRSLMEEVIPAALPELVGEDLANALNEERDKVLTDIEDGFRLSIRDSIIDALNGESYVYEAVIQAAYKGITCPDVTVSLRGTFSQALVSSFLSVKGGGVLSTAGAVGLVGDLNVIGIPMGKFRGFAMGTDSQGLPNPALCGTLDMQIGPLSASQVRMAFTCEECITSFLEAFGGLVACLLNESGEAVEAAVRDSLAKVAPEHSNLGAAALDSDLTIEQKVALFAELFNHPPDALQFSECFVNSMIAAIEAVNPVMRACATGPKLFGMPIGISPVFGAGAFKGMQFEATKSGFAGAVSWSPGKLFAESLLLPISLAGGSFIAATFPPFDEMTLSVASETFQPAELFLAALKGELSSPEAFGQFIANGFERAMTRTVYGIQHKFNPMGLKLQDNQARLVMPNLVRHPADPRTGWPGVPEDNGLPSRPKVLLAALGQEFLGNALWKGDAEDLFKVFPPGSPERVALTGKSFGTDYFPHGGFVGAGSIALPAILAEAPPPEFAIALGSGDFFERLEAASTIVDQYILNTTPAGNIAMYVPAPNPPILTDGEGGELTPKELLDAILSVDPTNVALAPFYPTELLFLEGKLNGKILGVPVLEGTLSGRLPNPETGEPAHLEAITSVPEGSWISPFLESAELSVKFSQAPPLSIEDYFLTVQERLQSAIAAGRDQDPEQALALLDDIRADFIGGLPKTSIAASLDRLRVPEPFATWLAPAEASAQFSAFSPLYEPDVDEDDPLSEVKRKGGIAFESSAMIGGFINMPEMVLSVAAPTFTELPSLHAKGSIEPFKFPPTGGFTLFEVESPLGDDLLEASADFDPNGSVDILIDPITVSSPFISSGSLMQVYNVVPTEPFSIRSSGPWSATLEFGGATEINFPDGTPAIRFGEADDRFEATLSGEGFDQASIHLAINQSLTVTAFPGNPDFEQTIALDVAADRSIELFVSSDGTFFLEGSVGDQFSVPLVDLPVTQLKTGARVRISNDGLRVEGEYAGGALELVGIPEVTGLLEISFTTGVRFEADASIPASSLPLHYGVFEVDALRPGQAIPMTVSNAGFEVGSSVLRIPGISVDLITLESMQLFGNGDFSAVGSNGALTIPNFFELTAGDLAFTKEGEDISLSFQSPSLTLMPNSPMQTKFTAPVQQIEMESNGRMYVDTGSRTIPLPGLNSATGRIEIGYEPDGALPLPSLETTVVDFGSVGIGDHAVQTVRLTNIGGATLVGSSLVEEGSPIYQIAPPLYVLEPGEAIDLEIYFFPNRGQDFDGTINLPSTRFDDLKIAVTGRGLPQPIFRPSVTGTMDFGAQPVGGGLNRQLLISNIGSDTLNITDTQLSGPFSITPRVFDLAPGDSRSLFLTFRPTDRTDFQSTLTWLTNDEAGQHQLQLTGSGSQVRWYKQRHGGPIIRDIFMVNSLVGWAVGEQGTLLKTTTGGRAWSAYASPTGRTLNAVAFASDGLLGWIAGDAGTVFETEDGGETWQPITESEVQDPSLSWKDVEVYLRGGRERLVLVGENSSNGRAALTYQTTNTAYRSLNVSGTQGLYAVDAHEGWVGAVGANGLLVYTFNGGISWRESRIEGANAVRFNGVSVDENGSAVAVANGGLVFRAGELGDPWSRILNTGTVQNLYAADRSGDSVWVSGESGVIIHSVDGGATWIPETVNTGSSMFAIAVDGDQVWAGGRRGEIHHRPVEPPSSPLLLLSTDRIDFGLRAPGRVVSQTIELRNAGPSTLNFGSSNVSGDEAFTVQGVDVNTLEPGETARLRVTFLPGNPGVKSGLISLRPQGDQFSVMNIQLLGESAGSSWSLLDSPTTEHFEDIQFLNETLGFAITEDEVYRTKDGGGNWEALDADPPGPLGRVHFATEEIGYVVGGTSGSRTFQNTEQGMSTILRTTDGGNTWTTLTTGVRHRVTDIVTPVTNAPNFVYAMTESYVSGNNRQFAVILRSTNSGNTWSTVNTPSATFLGGQAIHVSAGLDVFFVASGNVLYRSTSGGNSWTEVISVSGSQLIQDIHFIDNNHGWVVGLNGLFRRTETGGATPGAWSAATSLSSGDLRRVHFVDANTGWIAGEGSFLNNREPSLFRSLDGGRNWVNTFVGGDFTTRSISALSADQAFACGVGGALVVYSPTQPVSFGLVVASERLDFGDVDAGDESALTLQYTNVGNREVKLMGLRSLSDQSLTSFQYDGQIPNQLNPGESFVINVRFQSKEAGDYDGELELLNDGLDSVVSTDLSAVVSVEDQLLLLDSEPTGLSLIVNGETRQTPVALTIRPGGEGEDVVQPGQSIRVEAPESVNVDAFTYRFVSWEPSNARVFTLEVPEQSQTWEAGYEPFISTLLQVIRPLSVQGGRGEMQPAAVLPPIFQSDFIETIDAPPGPWIRLSGPGLGQSAVITNPLLGTFPLNVSAYLAADAFDMSLQSVPMVVPGGSSTDDAWLSVTPGSLDIKYRRDELFRMIAASGGMSLFGFDRPGSSHVVFEMDPSTGGYVANVTLDTDLPLIEFVCEFAAGSQLTIDTRNGTSFSFDGRLRMFRDPLNGWVYDSPYEFESSFEDFELVVDDLTSSLALWSDGFIDMTTGASNPNLFVRRTDSGYEAGMRNVTLGLFGESITIDEMTANSDGEFEVSLDPLDLSLSNIITLSTDSDASFSWNALNGSYALVLPEARLKVPGNGHWPANGVTLDPITITKPEFNFVFPFNGFTFAGLELPNGSNQDMNDNSRYLKLSVGNGSVAFEAKNEITTTIGSFSVSLNVDDDGISGSAIGSIETEGFPYRPPSVDPLSPGFPEIPGPIEIGSAEISYDSEGVNYPFKGQVTFGIFDLEARFGPSGGQLCRDLGVLGKTCVSN